jgi:hypothetical protein
LLAGSQKPVGPKKTNKWGCGAAGSVLEWHSRGRGFDPRQLHFLLKGVNPKGLTPFFVVELNHFEFLIRWRYLEKVKPLL